MGSSHNEPTQSKRCQTTVFFQKGCVPDSCFGRMQQRCIGWHQRGNRQRQGTRTTLTLSDKLKQIPTSCRTKRVSALDRTKQAIVTRRACFLRTRYEVRPLFLRLAVPPSPRRTNSAKSREVRRWMDDGRICSTEQVRFYQVANPFTEEGNTNISKKRHGFSYW